MATLSDLENGWIILLEEAISSGGGVYVPATPFADILPRVIEYVENRIYRSMVFLAERKTDSSKKVTIASRYFDLSAMNATTPLVVEEIALITPATVTNPALGYRYAYTPMSLAAIDALWPQEAITLAPNRTDTRGWAMKDNKTLVIMPTPDATYTLECTGIFQPTALSAPSDTNYISLTYPDMYLSCGMVFLSGFQRDFGAQAENPQMAMSWESTYQAQLVGAVAEEQRRRGLAPTDGSTTRAAAARISVPQSAG